jgi:hypothetical protein
LTLLVALQTLSSAATTIPEIVAKAKPAVVQVIASDANWSPIRTDWLRRFDEAKWRLRPRLSLFLAPSGVFVPQPTVPTLRLVTRVLGLPQYATVNFYTVAATTPYLSLTRASFIIRDVFFS